MSKFPIPVAAIAQHTIILGKTRSGKSSKMRLIVEKYLDENKPVCIIDPKGDWWGLKSSADGKKAGYPVVIFGSEWAKHADVRINKTSGGSIGELIATGNRPAVIDLKGMTAADRAQFFVGFVEAFFRHTKGHRVLAIDECHNFAPKGKVLDPQTGMMLHWANRLASEIAGMGVTLVSASQRPQKVHNDYSSSHETLIACRVIQKHDRDADKDWIDACGDPEVGKEVLGSLAGMPREEAWVYSPEIGFGPKRVKFPMFATYDSFKPQANRKAVRLKGWAKINLKEVQSTIAHVVEENKANDPKELRKRNAELVAKVAQLERTGMKAPAAKQPTVPALVDKNAIAAAEKHGFEQAKKKLGEAANKAAKTATAKAIATVLKSVSAFSATLHKELASVQKELELPKTAVSFTPAPALVARVPTPALRVIPSARSQAAATAKIAADDGAFQMTPAKQRILDAIAWVASLGNPVVPKDTIAFMADTTPNSSAYTNNLGSLRTAGLIDYPAGGMLTLTDAGRDHAEQPIDAPTHEAIMAKVADKLAPAQMRIVKVAAEAYPADLTKDELAEKAETTASSSAFTNNLGRLRTFGLLTYPAGGRVRADDRLFPQGKAA